MQEADTSSTFKKFSYGGYAQRITRSTSHPKQTRSGKPLRGGFARQAPTMNAHLVDEQIRLGHRFRNDLLAVMREHQEMIYKIPAANNPEISSIKETLADLAKQRSSISGKIKRANKKLAAAQKANEPTESLKARIERLTKEKEEITPKLAQMRKEIREKETRWREAHKAETGEATAKLKNAIAALRNDYRDSKGLGWGTAGAIIADVSTAFSRHKMNMKFKAFDGTGMIAVQLQNGDTFENIIQGKNTSLQIDPPANGTTRTKVRIRLSSDENRKPVWAEFLINLHRCPPSSGRIKWARVHRVKKKTRTAYNLQLDIELPVPLAAPLISVDLGWRRMGDGELRIGYAHATDEYLDLRLSSIIFEKLKKADDIRSIRDTRQNEVHEALIEFLKSTEVPDWLKKYAKTIDKWESPKRFVNLWKEWRDERFDGDEAMFATLDEWRKKDWHLHQYETGNRESAIATRKREFYWLARKILEGHKSLALEKMNVQRMSQHHRIDNDGMKTRIAKTRLARKARQQRQHGAPGEFRRILKEVADNLQIRCVHVPAPWTSKTCPDCGGREWNDADALVRTCVKCDAVWERDQNGCTMIKRRAIDTFGINTATTDDKAGRHTNLRVLRCSSTPSRSNSSISNVAA